MISAIEKFDDEEVKSFSKCIQKLLKETFVVEKLYSRDKNVMRNPLYAFIEEHESIFKEYLRVGGFELISDFNNGVYYINSSTYTGSLYFTKNTTIFMLVIRLIYEEKQESINVGSFITFTMAELLNRIDVLHLSNSLISESVMKKSMKTLCKFNFIEKVSGEYTDQLSMYVIYPSIIHCIDGDSLRAILEDYQKMKNDSDDEEGETI